MEITTDGADGDQAAERRLPGLVRVLACWGLTVAAADLLLWMRAPGIGWGLFLGVFMCAILASRARLNFDGLRWGLLALFVLTALQTGRFVSMSNFLTFSALLVFFAGDTFHTDVAALWRRCAEVPLGYLRPVGILGRLLQGRTGTPKSGLLLWLRVAIPVSIVFLIFLGLLGSGNSVLAGLVNTTKEFIARLVSDVLIPDAEEAFFLGFMAVVTLPLIAPPLATRFGRRFEGQWPELATKGSHVRRLQWRVGLSALNALFLISNVIDVIYLWAGRALPAGTSHSAFVHDGVYALIWTTILSAFFMALLTQHDDSVRKDRYVRLGCYAWLVQNVVLISGVYLRLWIYVDAYGYTPKRVYVGLFLLLVLGGYTLITYAMRKGLRLKWLVGANCVLLFGFFASQQFLNVPGFVVQRNLARYSAGEWQFPGMDFVQSVGSESIPLYIGLMESPQSTPEAKERAAEEIVSVVSNDRHWAKHRSGLSFQWRAAANYQAYLDARERLAITK